MDADSADRIAFCERLRAARNDLRLTQPAVANYLVAHGYDASKQAVSSWEHGRNLPDVLVLKRLCHLYGCTPDSLLWTDEPADDTPMSAALVRRIRSRLSGFPCGTYEVRP